MTHFLDISHDVPKTDLDIENLKGIFKNKAWSDLPVIMKLKGNPNFDYKTQYFIQEQSNGNYTLIKHVYLTKQRFPQAKVEACAMGKLYGQALRNCLGSRKQGCGAESFSGCWSKQVVCNSGSSHFRQRKKGM